MNRIYSLLLICLFIIGVAQAQAPAKFSYQAVVRDGSGALIGNAPVGIQITISESSATGTAVYVERHTINSNENGLVSIEIGGGTIQSGNFSTIDWGNNNYFLKSEIDPNGGTSYTVELSNQLLSVPYALYANSSGNSSSTGISISSTDTAAWNNDLVDDADSDPTNEIQDLSLAGNILTITNNGSATSIDLSTYLDNTDTSSLTETEVDAFVSNNGYITTEVDGSTTNEIQDLNLSGNNLTITNNGSATSIDLSTYLDNTDTQLDSTAIANMGFVANNGSASNHYIGELFGGGIIFYLWKDATGAEHGLIIDTVEMTNSLWSNVTNGTSGATSTWDGLSNSTAIISQSGHTQSAASLCLNSTNGGQSDWYLPAIDELRLIWQNSFIINKSLSSISAPELGNSGPVVFASSSEFSAFLAFLFVTNDPNGVGIAYSSAILSKGSTVAIRAVRSF